MIVILYRAVVFYEVVVLIVYRAVVLYEVGSIDSV